MNIASRTVDAHSIPPSSISISLFLSLAFSIYLSMCPKINSTPLFSNEFDKHPKQSHSISVSLTQKSTTRKWFVQFCQQTGLLRGSVNSAYQRRANTSTLWLVSCDAHFSLNYNDIAILTHFFFFFTLKASPFSGSGLVFLFVWTKKKRRVDFDFNQTVSSTPIGISHWLTKGEKNDKIVNIACKWINEPYVMQTQSWM